MPSLDLAHPLNADEPDRQEHEQDDEGIGRCGGQELHADETREAKQRQVQHRPAHAPLDNDEGGKEDGCNAEKGDNEGIGPTALGRLQHAAGQRGKRDGEGGGSRPVEPGCVRVARFGDGAQAERGGGNAKHRHQKKDRAPAERVDEQAGGNRAEGKADAEAGAKEAEGAQTRLPVEFLGKRRGAAGEGGSAANALQSPEEIEPDDAWRQHAAQRG